MTRFFVPADSTARALGADRVAQTLKLKFPDADIERNGSFGLYWLEPMVEVEHDGIRHAFGPVRIDDVASLLNPDGTPTLENDLYLGPTQQMPWIMRQQRTTFARVGLTDPLSVSDYEAQGGLQGLRKALASTPNEVLEAVAQSGLRGRGGAAFPTGIKWRTAADAEAETKYIACNADEGDSGTFADRMLMESDPFSILEGMAIAAYAVGANKGFIYVRCEYPQAIETLHKAVKIARQQGWLGEHILGAELSFDIEIREASGAYICGEETAMLESLEGKRGMVRYKPPLPAHRGLFGQPTVVNNVVTLATVPTILADGANTYADLGRDQSRGTLTVQLSGNVRQGGLFELPFGITLKEVLYDLGGGTRSGRPILAVQVGGPLGAYIPPSQFDTPLEYEAFAKIGGMLGHGGIVVFDDTADLGRMAEFAMEFCAYESCGKCTPCRIGSVRGVEVIQRLRRGENTAANAELLDELCHTMIDGSLCALGGMAPYPVQSIMRHFPSALNLPDQVPT